MSREEYLKAYAEGYMAGLEKARAEAQEKEPKRPYVTVEDIMEDYQISKPKAYGVLRGIRMACNGGMLNHEGCVKRSEYEYWKTLVDKQYKARL